MEIGDQKRALEAYDVGILLARMDQPATKVACGHSLLLTDHQTAASWFEADNAEAFAQLPWSNTV